MSGMDEKPEAQLHAGALTWEMGDAAAALNAAELGDGFVFVAVRYDNGSTAVREANMSDLDAIISDLADWPFGGATVYAFVRTIVPPA